MDLRITKKPQDFFPEFAASIGICTENLRIVTWMGLGLC